MATCETVDLFIAEREPKNGPSWHRKEKKLLSHSDEWRFEWIHYKYQTREHNWTLV